MRNGSSRPWGIRVGVTACIAIAGAVGTAVPAQASVQTTHSAAVVASSTRTAAPERTHGTVGSKIGSATGSPSTSTETRSWGVIIRTAINALKKIPALWKKVVDGAKRSASWFKANVWPSIKATVHLVSTLLTAQEIWKFFN